MRHPWWKKGTRFIAGTHRRQGRGQGLLFPFLLSSQPASHCLHSEQNQHSGALARIQGTSSDLDQKALSLSSQCHTGTVPRWNPRENKNTFLFCTSGCRKSSAAGLRSLGVSVIKDVLWALGLGVPMACGPASQTIDIRVASGRQRAPPGSSATHPARLSCQGVSCLGLAFLAQSKRVSVWEVTPRRMELFCE